MTINASSTRLQGRFTLYGEYLMHSRTWGYVAPTPMYLEVSSSRSDGYDHRADQAAHLLQKMGFHTALSVSGDLPFGLGFASSTVLAFLHLRDQASESDHRQIINVLDWMQHGFKPSGVDYAAIQAQSPGFFFDGHWRPAPPCHITCVFIALPAAPSRPAGKTRAIVESIAPRLQPLGERLTRAIELAGAIALDDLYDYAELLAESGVYSPIQQLIATEALSSGLIAKGIGGLYNKAMIVIGEAAKCQSFASLHPSLDIFVTSE